MRHVLFAAGIVFCLTPWSTPPIALALGLALALTVGHPLNPPTVSRTTRILLQLSVIGLGFGMSLEKVMAAGRSGVLLTVITIVGTLVMGYLLGRAMGIPTTTSHLIASGTAICGGSAIAAVGPVVEASDEEMSVSLGTVFILNAVALFVFPVIGLALGMTQSQFGLWAGIAIHDTSSVVGAAARYGAEALQVATTVKLARALWIVPLTLLTAFLFRKGKARIVVPWFILGFVAASVLRTALPAQQEVWDIIVLASRTGLTVTLFLIGANLSRRAIATVGARPLILGVTLWLAISASSLWAVMSSTR